MNSTELTKEIVESFGFKRSFATPDWDDKGWAYDTKWATLMGLDFCNNEPCEMTCIEGEFYTEEGEEYYVTVEYKEQLEALEACETEEEVIALDFVQQ